MSSSPPFLRRRASGLVLIAAAVLVSPAAPSGLHAADAPFLKFGGTRQLFIDEFLFASKRGIELKMHQPVPREVVIVRDKPWEDGPRAYVSVFKDGDKYRMYYRCSPNVDAAWGKPGPGEITRVNWSYTALAESKDGIVWEKPNLGVVEYLGSKQNNLVWPTDANKPWRTKNYPGSDVFPFKDENPAAPPEQRYKALANLGEYELVALVSPDGISWKPLRTEPVISYPEPDPMMDPPSVAFWDKQKGEYVAYLRCWLNYRIRGFRRVTSKDFVKWSKAEVIEYIGGDVENLYTSMATPYERAPGITLFFSKRFITGRVVDPQQAPGLSEIVLLTSRDGLRFDRTFMEPFLPPGLGIENWHNRAIMMGRGIVATSPTELSLYYLEHYHRPTNRIRRATIRPDGFVSVHAGWSGGEFVTKPFLLEGDELELNFATSVAGSIKVEILDENGKPVAGHRLEECDEIYGDELDRTVSFRRGHSDVLTPDRQEIPFKPSNFGRALKGRVIQLRFVMKAADLYSFRIK